MGSDFSPRVSCCQKQGQVSKQVPRQRVRYLFAQHRAAHGLLDEWWSKMALGSEFYLVAVVELLAEDLRNAVGEPVSSNHSSVGATVRSTVVYVNDGLDDALGGVDDCDALVVLHVCNTINSTIDESLPLVAYRSEHLHQHKEFKLKMHAPRCHVV